MEFIKARPGGNTPDEFREIAAEFDDVCQRLETAIRHLNADPFHGRNYAHLAPPEDALGRAWDNRVVGMAWLCHRRLARLADALASAADNPPTETPINPADFSAPEAEQ